MSAIPDNPCPICGDKMVVEEDWESGRVTRCQSCDHRHVERFDELRSAELLDPEEEKEGGNDDAA